MGLSGEDLIGKRIGNYTIISDLHRSDSGGRRIWRVRCVCGFEREATVSYLRKRTRHHGCPLYVPHNRKSPGEASLNALIRNYKNNAVRRGIEFSLTKEDMRKLFMGDCFYCGSPPSQKISGRGFNGEFIYNGIDRMNNSGGYVLGNVASCCRVCNERKRAMDVDDFLRWVKAIYEHRVPSWQTGEHVIIGP